MYVAKHVSWSASAALALSLSACEPKTGMHSRSREHVLADFDSDGHVDVVVAVSSGHYLLRGPDFAEHHLLFDEAPGGRFAASDVDGDGVTDLVYGGPGLTVLFGGATFPVAEKRVRLTGGCLHLVGLTDVDGDGALDMLCVAGGNRVGIHTLRGDVLGGFEEPETRGAHDGCEFSGFGDARLVPSARGGVDVLLGCLNHEMALAGNDGQGWFAATWSVGRGPSSAVVAGDFDGDGRPDFAAAQCSGRDESCMKRRRGKLLVRLSVDGGLGDARAYDVGVAPVDLGAADLDGDRIDDIVVANAASSELTILYSRGGPRIVRRSILAPATAVTVGDVDHDGDIDVIVSVTEFDGPYSVAVGILTNDGTGQLREESYHELPRWGEE